MTTKSPKNPFLAHIETEFGGHAFFRCPTLEVATKKATKEEVGIGIKIVRRYVTDTKGKLLAEII